MAKRSKKLSDSNFLGLEYIGFCRSKLNTLMATESVTYEELGDFFKWQICKIRNVLWLDPIWDQYTFQDLAVEYFGILFDENEEYANEFLGRITQTDEEEFVDWAAKIERSLASKKLKELAENPPEEFEDKYG